jgi:hypothetical protein
MKQKAGRIAIYTLTALGVFWLPFHVPLFSKAYSTALIFHFNNQVAFLSLMTGLALATLWSWREPRSEPQRSEPQIETPASSGPNERLPLWPLGVAWAVSSIELTLVCMVSGWVPMDSAGYFIDRLFCLQGGLKPYRDFEFAYGPLIIYIPDTIRRLTGLSVEASYLVALWMFAWTGFAVLWWVIRQVCDGQSESRTTPAGISRRTKIAAFLLLSGYPMVSPEFGIQYTLTRYTSGLAALVLARIVMKKFAGRWFVVAVCHLLLVAAVGSISPEIALAFFATLIVYWTLEYLKGSKWLAYTAAAQLGMIVSLAIVFIPRDMFLAVRGFGSGVNNMPLFPSPYMLLFVGSLLAVVAPILADGVRAMTGDTPHFQFLGSLTLPIAVFSVCMIPAVLGRADSGHVLYNGTAVFLLALLVPSITTARAIRPGDRRISRRMIFQAAFLVVFPVMTAGPILNLEGAGLVYLTKLRAVEWSEAHPTAMLAHGVRRVLGEAQWNRLDDNLLGIRQRSLERLFPSFSSYGKVCDPLGEAEIFSVLGRHQVLKLEYYYTLTDEFPADLVDRKIQDMRSCQYAIVPRDALVGLPPVLPLDMDDYSRLLMFPLWGPVRIPPVPPKQAFFQYVKDSFIGVREVTPGLYLVKKRPAVP